MPWQPLDRELAKRLGREALHILNAGGYRAPSGREVRIAEAVERARRGTVAHPPDESVPDSAPGSRATRIEMDGRPTLDVARDWSAAGLRPLALNFASATHPGGGFLSGARAQEESIARSSGLFACLDGQSMYLLHKRRQDALYTDYALYSPDVPVFRTDAGELLEEPYPLSILTCAAVNVRALLQHAPARAPEAAPTMARRVHRVLVLSARHGHGHLILGAWGCGAFGNDPETIARQFRDALTGPFRGVFDRVVFAIPDVPGDSNYPSFARVLIGE